MALENDFSGNPDVLRVIFSTQNPIHTLHLLKTEIPLETFYDYLEYLDAKKTMEEYANPQTK